MIDCEGEGRDMSTVGGFGPTPTPVKEEDDGEVGQRRGKAKTKVKQEYVKEENMAKSKKGSSVIDIKEEDDLVAKV